MKEQKELSLYIHIPFCKRKCFYCDFLSAPADVRTMEMYVQALLFEIQSYRKSGLARRKIKTIFIGGGTPSILAPEQIEKILLEIKTTFNISEDAYKQMEITMEMNPGTVTKEKCRAYFDMGINRVSIGLQSTCDEQLKALGRIHTFSDFMSTYAGVREAGFQNVNVDLMSALPGQTLEAYQKGLHTILNLNPPPEHISAYSLMIEEDTLFYEWYGEDNCVSQMPEKKGNDCHMTRLPLPDEDTERKMYEITKEILSTSCYERYEISNYAKKGHLCQHNVIYWRRGDYLGLGLGSASLINNERFSNFDELNDYIKYQMSAKTDTKGYASETCKKIRKKCEEYYQIKERSEFSLYCPRKELCKLNTKDRMEEFMFLGLRMMEGISEQKFEQCFHQKMMDVFGKNIDDFVSQHFLRWEKTSGGDRLLSLTDKGIAVSNVIFAQFLL